MNAFSISEARQRCHRSHLAPADWIDRWVDGSPVSSRVGAMERIVTEGATGSLVSICIPDAAAMDAARFEGATFEAYECIRSTLAEMGHSQPVRFWNFLPSIHGQMDLDRDRYMVFNAGRFAALSRWFRGPEQLPGRVPAASGVGHDGSELVIHCLAFARPGEAVENPRQVPAFCYSERYGPRPPCFARATVVLDPRDEQPVLFVAGTASIRGEQSVHQNDLPGQLEETIANLRSLIGAAEGMLEPVTLEAFTDLRIYHLRDADAPEIERFVRSAVGPAARLQMVRADICRFDLDVEIEGLAKLRQWRAT